MVMEVKLLQPAKQKSPKLVTELGMVMEVKLLQSWFVTPIDNQRVIGNTAENVGDAGGEGDKGKDLTFLTYFAYENSQKLQKKHWHAVACQWVILAFAVA